MSFSVDALQSLSRQRNINSQRNRETMTPEDDESIIIAAGRRLLQKFKRTVTRQDRQPIVVTIGQAVKSLANTVSNAINGIWQRKSRSKYRVFLDDVIVDGRDRPSENDSVKVALLSKVPIPRNRPTELIVKKNERMPGVSMPIEIPKGRRQRAVSKPKRRDLNVA